MVAVTSLGPLDDFPTITARDIRPGMLVKYSDYPAVLVSEVGYLPLSNRYVFGFRAQYVSGGFRVFSKVQETRVFNSDDSVHLIKDGKW